MLCLVFFITAAANAQDAIRQVQIEKVSSTQFRVKYQLNTSDDLDFNMVLLKIFRRRSGNVEEILSEEITPWSFNQPGGSYIYNWTTDPGTVITGDELQAKITLRFQGIAKSKSSKNNKLPIAHAGNFMEIHLPVNAPLMLNGSSSADADGKIVSYNWKQIGGPEQVHILQQDSSVAFLNGITKEGSYAFELTVKDQNGAAASDRIVITVKPAAVIPVAAPVAAKNDEIKNEIKKDSGVVKIQPAYEAPMKLKGGPTSALINLAVPGLGHYYVSGDYQGNGRKPVWFAVTAVYAGAVGAGIYYVNKSNQQFDKYNTLAGFREYQHDANGNIIGVRGGNEQEA
ncbi:MAG: PKD domain-containing protein [Flavisolibacter sp.]